MVNVTKQHVKNTLYGLGGAYLLGFIIQTLINLNHSGSIAEYLSDKKEAIVRNIDHYNTNIEIAKEPFLSQYKDSLEYAARDTTELGKEIQSLEEKISRNLKKTFLSWAGFFVD